MLIVVLAMRSKASRHASAGRHLSMRSVRTDVAARTVRSTSSWVYASLASGTIIDVKGVLLRTRRLRTVGECQME